MNPRRDRVAWRLAGAFLASIASVPVLTAQETVASPPKGHFSTLLVAGHPSIAASLERIEKRSLLWRTELETLQQTGRRAFVLTPDQIEFADPIRGGLRPIGGSVLAEVGIVSPGSPRIAAVVVVVNLPLLEAMHNRRGTVPVERNADLDRILIHEVYGHAFPYLRAGDVSGRCADPTSEERPQDACSIRRENALRAEMGFELRTDYGLSSLTIGRPSPGEYGLARLLPWKQQ